MKSAQLLGKQEIMQVVKREILPSGKFLPIDPRLFVDL